jgi:hypothetical protein
LILGGVKTARRVARSQFLPLIYVNRLFRSG